MVLCALCVLQEDDVGRITHTVLAEDCYCACIILITLVFYIQGIFMKWVPTYFGVHTPIPHTNLLVMPAMPPYSLRSIPQTWADIEKLSKKLLVAIFKASSFKFQT